MVKYGVIYLYYLLHIKRIPKPLIDCFQKMIDRMVELCSGNVSLLPQFKKAIDECSSVFYNRSDAWSFFMERLINHAKDRNPNIVAKLYTFI